MPTSDLTSTTDNSTFTGVEEQATPSPRSSSASQNTSYVPTEAELSRTIVTITNMRWEDSTPKWTVLTTEPDIDPTVTSFISSTTEPIPKEVFTYRKTTGRPKAFDGLTKTAFPETSVKGHGDDGSGGGYPTATIMGRDSVPRDELDTAAASTIMATTYAMPPSRDQKPHRRNTDDESDESHALSYVTTVTVTASPQGAQPGIDPVSGGHKSHTEATVSEGAPASAPPTATSGTPAEQPADQDDPTYCPFIGRPDIWTPCAPRATGPGIGTEDAMPSASGPVVTRNPFWGLSNVLRHLRFGVYRAKRLLIARADRAFTIGPPWLWSREWKRHWYVRGIDGEDAAEGAPMDALAKQNKSANHRDRVGKQIRPETAPSCASSPGERSAREDSRVSRTHATAGSNDEAMILRAVLPPPGEQKKTKEKASFSHTDTLQNARANEKPIRADITDLRRGVERTAQLVRAQRRVLENQQALIARQREDLARGARALRRELRRLRGEGVEV